VYNPFGKRLHPFGPADVLYRPLDERMTLLHSL
jgi:hypothetical protein